MTFQIKVADKQPPPSRLANKAEVAEFFEIHIATLDSWLRRGCPYRNRGGRGTSWEFDLLEVATWRLAPQGEVDSVADDPETMQPKDRKDWYDGEERRIRVAEKKGWLVPVSEVRDSMAKLLKDTMLTLDTLPDVIEREAGLDPGQADALQTIVRRQREGLHIRLTEDAAA